MCNFIIYLIRTTEHKLKSRVILNMCNFIIYLIRTTEYKLKSRVINEVTLDPMFMYVY